MKYIHQKAIDILSRELIKFAGAVFARKIATYDEEVNKNIEAVEFLSGLINAELSTKDEQYLDRYLQPMWEVNAAIKVLQKAGRVKDSPKHGSRKRS